VACPDARREPHPAMFVVRRPWPGPRCSARGPVRGAVRLDGRAIVDPLTRVATGHCRRLRPLPRTGGRATSTAPFRGRFSPGRPRSRARPAEGADPGPMPLLRPSVRPVVHPCHRTRVGLAALLALPVLVTSLLLLSADPPFVYAAQRADPPFMYAETRAPDPVGTWPLRPRPEVVETFDPPAERWGRGHRGVDLAGRLGQPVRTALGGRVGFVGRIAGVPLVVVHHGDTRTTYQPVDPSVTTGELVDGGDEIGTLVWFGTHCLPRACLHWGWLRGQEYLDPLRLVDAPRPVRLLPLAGAPVGAATGSVAPQPARPLFGVMGARGRVPAA
jgi:murein DD-endopeptidase MepM/ murein hydrolase activator NlpD